MKIIARLIFVVSLPVLSYGQDLPLYSQYVLNPYLLNPSMTGMLHDGILQTTNRIQWTNIEDAPTQQFYQLSAGI